MSYWCGYLVLETCLAGRHRRMLTHACICIQCSDEACDILRACCTGFCKGTWFPRIFVNHANICEQRLTQFVHFPFLRLLNLLISSSHLTVRLAAEPLKRALSCFLYCFLCFFLRVFSCTLNKRFRPFLSIPDNGYAEKKGC